MSEIADPEWLGSFRDAVTTFQWGQGVYHQYEGAEVVETQAEDLQR